MYPADRWGNRPDATFDGGLNLSSSAPSEARLPSPGCQPEKPHWPSCRPIGKKKNPDTWFPVEPFSLNTRPRRIGRIDRCLEPRFRDPLRSGIHEGAPVKTGAGRSRDFPNIHSASSAKAERHERIWGRPHSHRRRRIAPCRTSGCDLSPALNFDVGSLLAVLIVSDRS